MTMGLTVRPRCPVARLAAGAAVGGAYFDDAAPLEQPLGLT